MAERRTSGQQLLELAQRLGERIDDPEAVREALREMEEQDA